MSLGAITPNPATGSTPTFHQPLFLDLLQFAGDNAYPTGGTTAFQAKVQAALARGAVEVVSVVTQDCGGYTAIYDKVNDKLKVYRNGAINSPQAEVPATTDLSGTSFTVLVTTK